MALSQAHRVYLGFVQGCSPGPLSCSLILAHMWARERCHAVTPFKGLCLNENHFVSARSHRGLVTAANIHHPGQSWTLIMPPPRCGTKLINATCIHHCPLHGGLTFRNAQQITPQGPLTPAYSFLPFKRICRVMTDTRSYSPTSLHLHSPIFIPLPSSQGFQKAKLILLHVTGDDSAL